MRFSLKWILIATAYIALAAAALSVPSYGFLLALWAISLLAASYAVLIAIAASGRSRLIAAGYALISTVAIVFLGILFLGRVPTPWHSLALSAAKPGANLQAIHNYRRTFTSMRRQNNPALAGQMQRYVDDYRLALQIHSLNAISVLAAGCIGALLGLWAYRRANPSADNLADSR